MQIPYWRDQPALWDELVLAGRVMPGLAKVTIKGGQDIDVKKAPGAHGAQLTYKGYAPKDVSIVLRFWTAEQWIELQRRIQDIEPKPGKKTLEPLDITHPVSKFRNVKAIAIKDIDGPTESGVRNCMELKISAIEFFPPAAKKATVTPTRSLVDALNSTPLSQAGAIVTGLLIPIDPVTGLTNTDPDFATNDPAMTTADRAAAEKAQKASEEEGKKIVSWSDGTKSVGPNGKHYTEPSKSESAPQKAPPKQEVHYP